MPLEFRAERNPAVSKGANVGNVGFFPDDLPSCEIQTPIGMNGNSFMDVILAQVFLT